MALGTFSPVIILRYCVVEICKLAAHAITNNHLLVLAEVLEKELAVCKFPG